MFNRTGHSLALSNAHIPTHTVDQVFCHPCLFSQSGVLHVCGNTMHKSSAYFFLERDMEGKSGESWTPKSSKTFGSSDQQLLCRFLDCFKSYIDACTYCSYVQCVYFGHLFCIQVLGQTTARHGPVTVGCSDTWVASICQIQAWFITRL